VRVGRLCVPSRRSAGLSLLEWLVASFIAWSLIAAALVQTVSARRSQRLQAAQTLLAEDAQIAIDLLRADLMMAGYARPLRVVQSPGGPAAWQTALTTAPLWACDHGFASLPSNAQPVCAAAPGAGSWSSSAVEIAYEADGYSTVLGSDGRPTQPLVDNVEAMALWLGQALPGEPGQVVRFIQASQVDDWARVRSVRLCLLLRSSEALLASADEASYWDCQGRRQASSDGRLRRAFHASVALRNHGPR